MMSRRTYIPKSILTLAARVGMHYSSKEGK